MKNSEMILFVLSFLACSQAGERGADAVSQDSLTTRAATRDKSLGSAVSPLNEARSGLEWRAVDSAIVAPWNEMGDPMFAFAVEVRVGGRVDTLANVIEPSTIAANDSVLSAVAVREENGESKRDIVVVTSAGTRRTPVPNDALSIFHDLTVSPDGGFLAYVALGNAAVIYDLSTRQAVYTSASAIQCDCDVDRNHARWVAADSAEIALDNAQGAAGGWLLVAVRLRPVRASVQAVSTEPNFHGPAH